MRFGSKRADKVEHISTDKVAQRTVYSALSTDKGRADGKIDLQQSPALPKSPDFPRSECEENWTKHRDMIETTLHLRASR